MVICLPMELLWEQVLLPKLSSTTTTFIQLLGINSVEKSAHLPFSPILNASVQMTSSRNSGLSRWLISWLLYGSHKQIWICVCLNILMMLCWNKCWMWAETYDFLTRKKLFKAIFTKLPIFWHFSNHSNTKKENK